VHPIFNLDPESAFQHLSIALPVAIATINRVTAPV